MNARLLLTSYLALLISDAGAGTISVPADHATIQGAIDAAGLGDTILVAAGTYRERLVLRPGVSLRSEGNDQQGQAGLARAEKTILDGGGAGKEPGVVMAEGATLDGFTITGMGRYDEAAWKKHHAEQGENQAHEHIGGFGAPAIGIAGMTCTVRHNIVHHNGDTGIAIRGEKGRTCAPLVTRNICYRNMGGGIGSMGGSTALILENTCYENFYAGIGHNGASPLVTGNVCYGNVRAGIGISEGACPVVRGNVCYENRRAGIGIRTGKETRPVVEDNECHHNAMAGIGSEEEASPVIRNNRCHHNQLAGIGSRGHASPFIIGNHVSENQAAGIGLSSATALIHGNHSEKNALAGIGISGQSRALVLENICIGNKLVALGLPDGATALVHGNKFSRVGGMPPLVAVLGKSSAILTRNELTGGGIAGVLVDGSCLLHGNTLKGAQGANGVWIRGKATALLHDNTIRGYKTPINDQADSPAIGNTLE